MADLYGHGLFRTDIWSKLGTPASVNMNSGTTRIGWVGRFPKAGSVTDIWVYCVSITGTSPVYDARLEAVTAGEPNDSLIAANTNKTFTPTAAAGAWHTLTAPYTATLNGQFAVVITDSSGTIDGSNFAALRINTGGLWLPTWPLSLLSTDDGGTWTRNTVGPPMYGIRYSDGTIHCGFVPLQVTTSATGYNTGSTPDEFANKFVCPYTMSVDSADAQIRFVAAGSAVQYMLYNDSGTDLVAASAPTLTEADDSGSTSEQGLVTFHHTAVTLTGGQTYYAAIKPTNANSIRPVYHQLADQNSVRACFGDCYLSTRTDAGAWSDSTDSFLMCTPRQSSVTSGGGRLISGGLVS